MISHRPFCYPALLALSLLLPGVLSAATDAGSPADKTNAKNAAGLVTVNGEPITQELYAAFLREQLQKDPKAAEGRERQMALLNRLVNFALLSQDAEAKGIDRQPAIAAQLELARNRILTNAAIQTYLGEHKVSEETLRTLYKERYKQRPQTEYRISHILFDDEQQARTALERLKQGESFAALAKQLSRDSSAGEGGDLGWMSPAQMEPALLAAAEKLADGEFAKEPVKSPFGWHLVKRDKSREIPQASYGEVRDTLLRERQRALLQGYIAELRKNAKLAVKTLTKKPTGE